MKKKILLLATIVQVSLLQAGEPKAPPCCKGPVLCPISPLYTGSDCNRHIHLDLGLLYQQPKFFGMNAGTLYTPAFEYSDVESEDPPIQTIKDLNECLPYAIGLTVSAGKYLEHDNWYVGGRFDYLSSNAYSLYDDTDQPTYVYAANANVSQTVTSGTDWDWTEDTFDKITYTAFMDIYVLDLLLSRGSYHSKSFAYEPFIGVKALWFKTNQMTSNYVLATNIINYITWKETQNNWGVGPMFGFNGIYHFTCNLAIFSDSDIALLYGEARNRNISTLVGSDSSQAESNQVVNHADNVDCQYFIPVRSVIGLQISDYFYSSKHYVALKIGYDIRSVIAYPNDQRGFSMGGLYANLIWNF